MLDCNIIVSLKHKTPPQSEDYDIDGDRLDVGGHIFTITDERLIYNADKSPEYVWAASFSTGVCSGLI